MFEIIFRSVQVKSQAAFVVSQKFTRSEKLSLNREREREKN